MTEIATVVIDRCALCGSPGQAEIGSSVDFEYQSCTNAFHFVRCTGCGLAYLRNRPTPETLGTIYGSDYIPHHFEEYLGGFIAGLRRRVQAVKVRPLVSRLDAGAVIVDVGPGNGEFLSLLKSADRGWKLYGVDFADEAVEAVGRVGATGIRARFETLQWDGPGIDAITMNQVIEHLEDPAAAVRKSFEILKPGGILFLETPSIDGWDYRLFKRRHWGGWHTPRHWHLFDERTLARLVERQGFRTEEVTYLLSPNFWLQSVHHWLHERGWPRLADVFDVSVLPSLILASALDVAQRTVAGHTSNFRLIARKPV